MREGWEVKKLGDVCENLDNQRIPITKNKREAGNIPYYGASGIVDYVKDYLFDEDLLLVSEDGANLLARTYPIAFSISGQNWVNNHAHVLKFDSMDSQKYVEYYFNSMKLDDYISGMAQPKLNQKMLNSIPIPIPPLPEQTQIVKTLDLVFTKLDLAKANLEQSLHNAKELFESKLGEVFSQRGEGWVEKRFDEVCVLQRGFDLPTRLRNKGTHPLVSSNGISDKIDIWKVKSPGVVTGRSGTIGKVHFIEKDFFPLNTALYIKNFHGNYERCIYYFLKQFDLSRYQSGAGVPTLNRNNVHSEKVYYPSSHNVQEEIVDALDNLSLQSQSLQTHYQQKLNNLEELKKSILERAFRGEL